MDLTMRILLLMLLVGVASIGTYMIIKKTKREPCRNYKKYVIIFLNASNAKDRYEVEATSPKRALEKFECDTKLTYAYVISLKEH